MRSASEIMQEILETEKIANQELDACTPRSRPGIEMAIRQAKDRLLVLKAEYKQVLKNIAFAVVITGDSDKVLEFSKATKAIGGVMVLDAAFLYETLATPVIAAIGKSHVVTANQLHLLTAGLRDFMVLLGIDSLPMLEIGSVPYLATDADVVAYVRSLVRNKIGDGLNQLVIEKMMVDTAVGEHHSLPYLVTVLLRPGADELQKLTTTFGKGTYSLQLTDDTVVDELFVQSAIKTAIKTIRKSN